MAGAVTTGISAVDMDACTGVSGAGMDACISCVPDVGAMWDASVGFGVSVGIDVEEPAEQCILKTKIVMTN